MTREEIIRMAREACLPGYPDELERFAALVAAAAKAEEREACAKVCEDDCGNGALNLAAAIRARGQE